MAQPRPLTGIPGSRVEQGNAFVAAWLTLRKDLDTMDYGNADPSALDTWMDDAPEFLLRDFARLSRQPQVALAAAKRLALGHKDSRTRETLRSLAESYANTPIGYEFAALRVKAMDKDYQQKLRRDEKSASFTVRMEAAMVLALAGSHGLTTLWAQLEVCGTDAPVAAAILARKDGARIVSGLEQRIKQGCDLHALHAAIGEILFRKLYPSFYILMLRRDPMGMRLQAAGGMYETWMVIHREAHKAGVRDAKALEQFVSGFREFAQLWPHGDPSVLRRHLDAFAGFISHAGAIVHARRNGQEPATFVEAMSVIKQREKRGSDVNRFAGRVSAAIRLCRQLGEALGYGDVPEEAAFGTLTPNGDRVRDGNLATTWRGVPGDGIDFVWRVPAGIRAIHIANGCGDEPGTAVSRIRVAPDGGKPVEVSLPENLYYSPVAFSGDGIRRLRIEILEAAGKGPVCIPEVRFDYTKK